MHFCSKADEELFCLYSSPTFLLKYVASIYRLNNSFFRIAIRSIDFNFFSLGFLLRKNVVIFDGTNY